MEYVEVSRVIPRVRGTQFDHRWTRPVQEAPRCSQRLLKNSLLTILNRKSQHQAFCCRLTGRVLCVFFYFLSGPLHGRMVSPRCYLLV